MADLVAEAQERTKGYLPTIQAALDAQRAAGAGTAPPLIADATVYNGKVRDVEAYHESSLYRDAHALFAPQPADKPPKRGPLD